MRHGLRVVPAILLICLVSGCAIPMGTWTTDVTHDLQFQDGYKPGKVYRLLSDGYLVASKTGTVDEAHALWSPRIAQHYPDRGPVHYDMYHVSFDSDFDEITHVATIPAGATVRVDRLQYRFSAYLMYFAPDSGEFPEVEAYGTVTTPSEQWRNVILPIDFHKRLAHRAPAHWPCVRDYVAIPDPDTDFLNALPTESHPVQREQLPRTTHP